MQNNVATTRLAHLFKVDKPLVFRAAEYQAQVLLFLNKLAVNQHVYQAEQLVRDLAVIRAAPV